MHLAEKISSHVLEELAHEGAKQRIAGLRKELQQLENFVRKDSKAATKAVKKAPRKMSAAPKKAISARMKKYWAAKKKAKQ